MSLCFSAVANEESEVTAAAAAAAAAVVDAAAATATAPAATATAPTAATANKRYYVMPQKENFTFFIRSPGCNCHVFSARSLYVVVVCPSVCRSVCRL